MKNIYLLSTLCLVVCTFLSCKKDKICTPSIACSATADYLPLAVGNYWIYEVTNYNLSTYSGTIMPYSDTIEVIDKVFFNGMEYYEIAINVWLSPLVPKDTVYWRDSIGYIVDQKGNVQFTAIDFDQVFQHKDIFPIQLDFSLEYQIKDSIVYELTPAGLFECLDFKGHLFRDGITDYNKAYHNYYTEGIGLVYQNTSFFSASSPIDIRRSLKEYHLME